ncbi:MAG: 4-hydroxy-tetrahydrodipicolinate reductase [Muribaculaceae bacterium]
MKLALIGYGKMGHAIEKIAKSRGHEIVCIIDKDNISDIDSPEFASADVAIEFSTPETAYGNYLRAFSKGVRVVSGTTGWTNRLPEIRRMCDEGRGTLLYSSNFSVGMNVFFALNKYLARVMNHFPQYDADITEIHHIHKLDHPSGTAITLAEGIIENIDRKEKWSEESNAENVVHIAHERKGEVPGTHIINYTSEVDKITITHEAFSREGLALGAVVAAEWLNGKQGFYTMDNVIDLNNIG